MSRATVTVARPGYGTAVENRAPAHRFFHRGTFARLGHSIRRRGKRETSRTARLGATKGWRWRGGQLPRALRARRRRLARFGAGSEGLAWAGMQLLLVFAGAVRRFGIPARRRVAGGVASAAAVVFAGTTRGETIAYGPDLALGGALAIILFHPLPLLRT